MAREFSYVEGVEFNNTPAPVAKCSFVGILWSFVSHFYLEGRVMNVTTAFLQGDIEEEEFIEGPNAISVIDGER